MLELAGWYLKRFDAGKLLTKLGGVGGSFVASHLVALTTTPQYAHFWNKLYLTAPTITDIPSFEKMVGTYFALGWLVLEHFYQRVGEPNVPGGNRATDPPAPTQEAK